MHTPDATITPNVAATQPDGIPWLYRRFVRGFQRRFRAGTLHYVLPNGAKGTIRGRDTGPEGTILLHRWRAVRRLIFRGSLGFAESYLDGDWESPDLPTFVELVARNAVNRRVGTFWQRVLDHIRHKRRSNTKSGSRRNIAAHYDLGNDFYAQWLDPSMTYSSAVYPEDAELLEEAQSTKYARLLELISAKPGERVLEIGCGWGGFAEFAARRGVAVTGITISPAQFEFAQQRIARAGLSDLVDIRLCDYRDVEGSFDHVVSIEMIEAVGESYWPVYFDRIAQCVRRGGRVAIQAITTHDDHFAHYRRRADFIQTYIFPGGMLPCRSALREHAQRVGLKWLQDDGFAPHYARTLGEWREKFVEAWPRIRTMGFDERFRRLWEFYLASCEGSFRARGIDVLQIALVKA
ncbi:MAG: cyclopropane-fatty-acyl-phospholipid synthase family protein [Alphaproteobacteria bacterium]